MIPDLHSCSAPGMGMQPKCLNPVPEAAEKLLRLEPGLAVDLRGTKASRQAVSGALAGRHAVFFFGHGTHGALVGAHGRCSTNKTLA
jgi:hypothetical protein